MDPIFFAILLGIFIIGKPHDVYKICIRHKW